LRKSGTSGTCRKKNACTEANVRRFFAELSKEKKADASDESGKPGQSATASRKRGRPRKTAADEAKSQAAHSGAQPASSGAAGLEAVADEEPDEEVIDLLTRAEDGSDELDSLVQDICKRETADPLD